MVRVEAGAVILAPGLLPLRPRREARVLLRPGAERALEPPVRAAPLGERPVHGQRGAALGREGAAADRLRAVRGLPRRDARLVLVGVLHVLPEGSDHREGARARRGVHALLHGHPGPRQGLRRLLRAGQGDGHPVRPVPALAHRRAGVEEPRVGFVPEDYVGEDEAGAYRTEEFDLVVLVGGPGAARRGAGARREVRHRAGRERLRRLARASTPWHPAGRACSCAGPFSEPKDIPETVVEASSAAAEAMVAARRAARHPGDEGGAARRRRDIAGQVPRIGVFVCHCGKNIGGVRGRARGAGVREDPAARRLRHGQPLHLLLGRAGRSSRRRSSSTG